VSSGPWRARSRTGVPHPRRPVRRRPRPSCTRPKAISMRPGGPVGSCARQAILRRMVVPAACRSAAESPNAGSTSYHSGYRWEACRCATWSGKAGSIHSARVPSGEIRYGGSAVSRFAQSASWPWSPTISASSRHTRTASRMIATSIRRVDGERRGGIQGRVLRREGRHDVAAPVEVDQAGLVEAHDGRRRSPTARCRAVPGRRWSPGSRMRIAAASRRWPIQNWCG